MSKPTSHVPFAHMQTFLDKTHGQITLGKIPPIERAALAAVGKKVHVALLLERLDIALGKVMADDSVIDEVLPEIKRRRSR
jgi:hypothetical protein